MIRVEDLKLLNNSKIEYLKKIGIDCKDNEIVSEILEDKACFFKMQKLDAINVLKYIGLQETKINEVYTKLISIDEFYYLVKGGCIKPDDKSLIIKYKMYDNDIFKKESLKGAKTKELTIYKENIFERIFNKIKKLFSK